MTERPHYVCFRLTEDEFSALDQAALSAGIDRSSLIRLKLLECFENYRRPAYDPRQTDLFPGGAK